MLTWLAIFFSHCLQGTTVRVELSDATIAADPMGAHTISRSFPHTYGQPLAHFLRPTAQVPDAQIITDHPAIRYLSSYCICRYYLQAKRLLTVLIKTFIFYLVDLCKFSLAFVVLLYCWTIF